jgi:nitrogenase subunit NifH
LKDIANAIYVANNIARRIKNMSDRLAKMHIHISINKLRDRKTDCTETYPQERYHSR